jgi:hypothetical protein
VGFASSTATNNDLIRSIQPIYYSEDPKVCAFLAESPEKSAATVIKEEVKDMADFWTRFTYD